MFDLIKHIEVNPQVYNRVAIHLDNSSEWLMIDSAMTNLGKIIVPIPHFFTPQQIAHMSIQAGLDTVICSPLAESLWLSLGFILVSSDKNIGLLMTKTISHYPKLPKGTHKITFTSGTTSEPKGVCLSLQHLESVGRSLAKITQQFKVHKHLSILPLSVLLENVAANYAAKQLAIEVITPPLAKLGLSGSSQLNVTKLINAIINYRPDSLILMPQMLKAIITYCQKTVTDLSFLKFIAVGGAVCSKGLLLKAKALKLPVFEGYGISECGSVISLNTKTEFIGSVGKVLDHQQVKISKNGEILTKGELYLGYLGSEKPLDEWYATGDLGRFDQDNNLHIIGRKKNTIINSYGRNISPDWIEAELLSLSSITQVAIYGEAQPFLTAISYSSQNRTNLLHELKKINSSLPDYAQVKEIIVASEPFTLENKMLTASGKTKHQQVFKHFKPQLEEIYAQA